MTKRILIIILPVIFLAGNFFCACVYGAELTPFDKTIRILERWTSSHWGQDCFVWIVHYPEEIIDSWVESESEKTGMNASDREAFRRNFIEDLQLNTSETFLVSIYSFGARPVSVNPVSENISLFTAAGERIKPVKYDSSLDNPSYGVVQGLVFFPKQSNKDYIIGVRGMGSKERVFSFAPVEEVKPAPVKQEKKPEVVVVNLPKKTPPKKKEPEVITPPPPPPIPPRPVTPLFQEDNSMEEFVNSMLAKSKDSTPAKTSTRPSNIESSYSSRESVLRKFLSLWAENSPGEMYSMLSENSRKIISYENFTREVARDSGLRSGLKSGDYRIDWIGEERAKVITTHKTLFIKSVATRTLGVTREGSSWKIVWY